MTPQIIAIYPAVHLWPANILRVHVEFDQPMRRTAVLQYIRLLDEQGNDLAPTALLDLPEGLWTPNQRLLTIVLHPGRVKTGLNAGSDYGPVFEVGRTYRWVVRDDIPSTQGQVLGRTYCRGFRVGAPILQPLPRLDGRCLPGQNRVRIVIDRVLDVLSMRSHLAVTTPTGQRIPATFSPSADGTAIIIELPERSVNQPLILRAHPHLEDVAGNRVTTAFESIRLTEPTMAV